MIKDTELRKGNFVNFYGHIGPVEQLLESTARVGKPVTKHSEGIDQIGCVSYKDLEPVLATDAWKERLGLSEPEKDVFCAKYVHDLQNIYFAMSGGKELQLKMPEEKSTEEKSTWTDADMTSFASFWSNCQPMYKNIPEALEGWKRSKQEFIRVQWNADKKEFQDADAPYLDHIKAKANLVKYPSFKSQQRVLENGQMVILKSDLGNEAFYVQINEGSPIRLRPLQIMTNKYPKVIEIII